ncbi:MAG: pyridoxal-phosphate dependent enzyme [Myxococcales bacterium]|nr:MAG: pyridoxal-phosphate dependent enzyme [Myxococcales bacterium]
MTPDSVEKAQGLLKGIVHRTPVMTCSHMDKRSGSKVFFKCENLQRIGAFKIRGAYHAIATHCSRNPPVGVVAHSSGNHAQGVALAAALCSVPAVIVMPKDASAAKVTATRGYGAEVVFCDPAERSVVAEHIAQKQGYLMVHPYDDELVIAGQGTAALELWEQAGAFDAVVVPVGGGGLISGTALALAHRGASVVGIEPSIAADAGESWRKGSVQHLQQVPTTMADGLRSLAIGEQNLAVMKKLVTDMQTVEEEAIQEAMFFVWSRMKLVIEPSAAVAVAAVLAGRFRNQRVGVILSGGNVDCPSMS